MGTRRKAREAAAQMLYQIDLCGVDAEQAIELFWTYLGSSDDSREFADELVRGWYEHRDALDDQIRGASKHWRLERMSRVDRNVIRLGAYELVQRQDIPARVSLNEAIEVAKRFGHEESVPFVNGILDRLAGLVGKD